MSGTTQNGAPALPRIPGLDLGEKIGEGGTSTVYRAVHRTLQRTVAVKVLCAPTDGNAAHPSWLREPQLMAALAHPHVVTVHDAGEVEGHNYLVMEFAAGGALRSRMHPGQPWSPDEAARLLDRIAGALDHIHERGILHLDLKPENVLFVDDGQIKITDFGISVAHTGAGARLEGGYFCGTLDYCAPEYRAGLTLDARADVFSLATVAYELFTGRLPGRVYVPALRYNPRLPKALDDALRRGLARDPDERYASIKQFQAALTGACCKNAGRVNRRVLTALGILAALVILPLAASKWWRPTAVAEPGSSGVQAAEGERPDRLVILYDRPDDLALFTGPDGQDLVSGSGAPVERVPAEVGRATLPPDFPFSVWPAPRPVLAIRSPNAWGFVYPLQDRMLAPRVVTNWSDLLRAVVPSEKNLVKAGGFDGDCLTPGHAGTQWRGGNAAGWSASRQIVLDRPQDRPDNQALLLTNLDPAQSGNLLGTYQPLAQGPPVGAVMILRYRARSLHGRGSLAVYPGMPVAIPDDETGPVATRVRGLGPRLSTDPSAPGPAPWLYRCPNWVVPTNQWRTYLVVCELPPYPTRRLHRNLVIDLAATPQAATDQVWVDDVELFVWRPESKP
ncbi:serine threonine protein kinase : Putative serine/threonine protein kinase OS=Gemmata sp. Wa1-1 PE=4 SV=1: Pkinase [Gemmata massiliana]|uniref:Protein kinase domain-containing protein n=1 Tax=Gemmata massiliana TaxID=1210884 RepID=A0A6P2D2C4_9BACT|nr:serine/threonine-protein kinase [Gemmata massiliana]VTR94545.1 serine threonine protein kinase : Putative serine/threonine protein kinase OS=Gemmata sp. Wa1-1 PE=4 SV=1: Pkinase [Gemmata massiliana]